ncbi:MAG: Wzz/FepE/Etk N-terminal domain-containing protein [Planctomycetota bacterium]
MPTELQPLPQVTNIEPDGPSVLDYLGMFRRRSKTILLPMLIMAILAGIVAFVIPPQYEAKTKFQIDDPGLLKNVVGIGGAIAPHKPLLNAIDDEIKNPLFLGDLITKVGINEGFNVSKPAEFIDLIKYIEENLKVQLDKANAGPDRVLISYTGRNQSKVVNFVNEIRDAYAVHFQKRYRDPSHFAYQATFDTVDNQERTLRGRQAALKAYLALPNTKRLLGTGPGLSNRLEKLREEEFRLVRNAESLNTQLAQASLQLKAMKPRLQSEKFIPNPAKESLRMELAQFQAEYNSVAIAMTDLAPQVKTAREKMERARASFAAEKSYLVVPDTIESNKLYVQTEGERNKIRRDLDANAKELIRIKKQIQGTATELGRVPEVDAQVAAIERDISSRGAELRKARLRHGRMEANWTRVRDASLFRTIRFPNGNEPPVFPSIPLFLAIGAMAGLLVGIGVAFLREFSGMTFATTAQVKNAMPLPVLGEVARIVSDAEEREERVKRTRTFLILGLVVILLGTLHLFYFEKSLSRHLPASVIRVMDKIYLGR